jgi:hypothetical protein
MSNVTRVLLEQDVTEVVLQADYAEAYAVLNEAVDISEREKRAMTLDEALRITQKYALQKVSEVARQVEALG